MSSLISKKKSPCQNSPNSSASSNYLLQPFQSASKRTKKIRRKKKKKRKKKRKTKRRKKKKMMTMTSSMKLNKTNKPLITLKLNSIFMLTRPFMSMPKIKWMLLNSYLIISMRKL